RCSCASRSLGRPTALPALRSAVGSSRPCVPATQWLSPRLTDRLVRNDQPAMTAPEELTPAREMAVDEALELLQHGDLSVEGRLMDASNATLYCSASLD